MALVVGANSWATVAEANDYLGDRIGATDWFELKNTPDNPGDSSSKESFLVSAYYWLTGSPDLSLPASLTATNVKNAQIEAALFLLEHYGSLNEHRALLNQGVTSFTFSKRSESLDKANLGVPGYILGMIPEYSSRHAFAQLKGEYDA